MDKKLRPIIKWTGGKYDEFALFADRIPTFARYIEPFFGGGGVFFALKPKVKSCINDKSTDLINFYQQIGNEKFKVELFKYADAWDELSKLHDFLWKKCTTLYSSYIDGKTDVEELNDSILHLLQENLKSFKTLSDVGFIIDRALFQKRLSSSIADKAKRIKRICEKEARVFSHAELKDHFETGIKSGAYLFCRGLLNKHENKISKLSTSKAAANWYFVRELCYGSMFRFNKRGEFNIPYGGIAYNRKKFRKKATKIFLEETTALFSRTEIYNLDFEKFLTKVELTKEDFIFLDPPYDSEFSEYDQSAFTQQDQKRLANFLVTTPAKWMVIIKETDFIKQIYTHPLIKMEVFDKNYAYNVRGRNSRGAKHLIITNY